MVTHLTAGHEGAMHNFGCWSADGQSFFMAANRWHAGRFDLYRQALTGGEAELVYAHEQAGYLLATDTSPDGTRLLLIRAAASASHELFELRLTDGQMRRLSPPGKEARYHSAFYTADGKTAVINTDLEYDFMYVARRGLDNAGWEPFVRHEWDVAAFSMSHNRRLAAYTVNAGGASECYLLDLAGGQRTNVPLPTGAPGVAAWYGERISFSADDTQIAFDYTSAVRTADVLVWRIGEPNCRQVTRSSHGGIPPESFVAPSLERFPTFDGREIPGWFFRPEEDARLAKMPVVVLVHGGPESQTQPAFSFLVQYLAHSGFAVFAPNVRGSTGYGKAFEHLDDVEKRMDSVADLAYANRWLREQPEIDPQRIAVYGGSYGGFMVLAALTNYPELWAAGIDVVGISNFVTFLQNTSEYRRAHRESEYGSLARDREFLERISPGNQLQWIAAPLMVVHGANDPRVPLSEAEQVAAALKGRDVPVELLVFDDEGHGIIKLHNKRVLYPAMAAFLERFLGGEATSVK
jgi:dipeptidyl aminopeptidase/acylaminoacyl peptidase